MSKPRGAVDVLELEVPRHEWPRCHSPTSRSTPGSEYNWIPRDILLDLGVVPVRIDRFETADGSVLEREVDCALLYAGGRSAATVVVFAEDGDMVVLGAHGLAGLNMRVDLGRKELVPARPVPAAAFRSRERGSHVTAAQRLSSELDSDQVP